MQQLLPTIPLPSAIILLRGGTWLAAANKWCVAVGMSAGMLWLRSVPGPGLCFAGFFWRKVKSGTSREVGMYRYRDMSGMSGCVNRDGGRIPDKGQKFGGGKDACPRFSGEEGRRATKSQKIANLMPQANTFPIRHVLTPCKDNQSHPRVPDTW